jgi:hypothetical protein
MLDRGVTRGHFCTPFKAGRITRSPEYPLNVGEIVPPE